MTSTDKKVSYERLSRQHGEQIRPWPTKQLGSLEIRPAFSQGLGGESFIVDDSLCLFATGKEQYFLIC